MRKSPVEDSRYPTCRQQGEDYWPLQQRAIEMIEKASQRGVDVAFDAYPWLAGSNVLTQILPQFALDGGIPRLFSWLRDPADREEIRKKIRPEARWNGVVITAAAHDEAALVGRSIQDTAAERGIDPESAVMDRLVEQDADVMIVEHCQSIDNLRALLTHPLATVITDGVYARSRSHPRLYATYPLLLGHMVRERRWLSLEEAVHKVTGKSATSFHLEDRGQIAKGFVADLVVFDPDRVSTGATYEKPDVAPEGIEWVLREGEVVAQAGSVAEVLVRKFRRGT